MAGFVGIRILVKGGHARRNDALDLLVQPDRPPLRFMAPRLPGEMRGAVRDLAERLSRFCEIRTGEDAARPVSLSRVQ